MNIPMRSTIATGRPHDLAERFAGDVSTLGIRFDEGHVVIQTSDPTRFYGKLTDIAANDGIDIQSIRCADDNLQSVFNYLVKG